MMGKGENTMIHNVLTLNNGIEIWINSFSKR